MKKIFLLAFVAVLFSACGDEITEVTEVVEPYTFTEIYHIYFEDMIEKVDAAGTYYEYEILEPALTDEVFDYGILQAFLYYNKEGKDTMCPLPFSDFLIDNRGFQWEEQFSVEFQPGKIKFIQKISDHSDERPIVDYYDVLVRFLW